MTIGKINLRTWNKITMTNTMFSNKRKVRENGRDRRSLHCCWTCYENNLFAYNDGNDFESNRKQLGVKRNVATNFDDYDNTYNGKSK